MIISSDTQDAIRDVTYFIPVHATYEASSNATGGAARDATVRTALPITHRVIANATDIAIYAAVKKAIA